MKKVATTSQRLKELRAINHINIRQLAKVVGVSSATVSRWETTFTPTIKASVIEKISRAYNVEMTWLLGFDVPYQKRTPEEEALATEIHDKVDCLDGDDLRKLLHFINFFLGQTKGEG